MMQSYAGQPVQAFALDLWNGSPGQCATFLTITGITYPLLRNAGSAGIGGSYATAQDVSFVIDDVGDIVYRSIRFRQNEVTGAINTVLDNLASGVDELPGSRAFQLKPPYPNPFNPNTTISWELASELTGANVKVDVVDMRGRRIARLLDTYLEGGREHSVQWNGQDDSGSRVSSGTYLAVVEVDGTQKARFLTLVK
jgi:hypothetical protein